MALTLKEQKEKAKQVAGAGCFVLAIGLTLGVLVLPLFWPVWSILLGKRHKPKNRYITGLLSIVGLYAFYWDLKEEFFAGTYFNGFTDVDGVFHDVPDYVKISIVAVNCVAALIGLWFIYQSYQVRKNYRRFRDQIEEKYQQNKLLNDKYDSQVMAKNDYDNELYLLNGKTHNLSLSPGNACNIIMFKEEHEKAAEINKKRKMYFLLLLFVAWILFIWLYY